MSTTAMAQGLIWNVPEPGAFVRYSGQYRQVTVRPQSADGDLTLQWQRTLEIRCLSRETATWQSEDVPCIWIELEVQTGQQIDGQLDSGPGSTRIYKVLVPEQAVIGKEFLNLEVPRAYLPVVKGYRKIGNEDVEALSGAGLQTYPGVSLLLIDEHSTLAGTENAGVVAGDYAADRFENEVSLENNVSRTVVNSVLWVSEEIPFGPVKWSVRIERDKKTIVDTRDQFEKHAQITVEMEAAQVGQNAVAKIPNQ